MTSLDVDISPSGDKASSVLGRVNNRSAPCDNSSVGAGCIYDHSSVDVPSIRPAGGLEEIPGETVSE